MCLCGRTQRLSDAPSMPFLLLVLSAPFTYHSGQGVANHYSPSLNPIHILNSCQITTFKGVVSSKQDPDKHHLHILTLKTRQNPYISQFAYLLECKHELDSTNQMQLSQICIRS